MTRPELAVGSHPASAACLGAELAAPKNIINTAAKIIIIIIIIIMIIFMQGTYTYISTRDMSFSYV
jgi:hypothetical protein